MVAMSNYALARDLLHSPIYIMILLHLEKFLTQEEGEPIPNECSDNLSIASLYEWISFDTKQ